MPAKKLSEEQLRDAHRLKQAFKLWQSSLRETGAPWTQDDVAPAFGFGQSALSQYLNGSIPLNGHALRKFCSVMGIKPAMISPSLVEQLTSLAEGLSGSEDDAAAPAQPPDTKKPGTQGYIGARIAPAQGTPAHKQGAATHRLRGKK